MNLTLRDAGLTKGSFVRCRRTDANADHTAGAAGQICTQLPRNQAEANGARG